MPARMAPTTGPNQYTCRRGVGERRGGGEVSVFVDRETDLEFRLSHPVVLPEPSDDGWTQRTRRVHASAGEPGLERTLTSDLCFFGILNITKRVWRVGSAHPQQHSGGVGEPDGQVSRFRVLPPSLLLHGEDGEHHLEGAQHLNGQSLSRIQLQGHLWGRGAGGGS